MGDSFVAFLCLVVGGNVVIMAVMTIEKYKRQRKLERLRRHQQLMLAELKNKLREQTAARFKKKMARVELQRQEKERKMAQKKLVMDQLVPRQKKEPILPSLKIESQLNNMKRERRRLELGLKEALLTHQRKSAWRRKQIKAELCKLDIIPEDSEHDDSSVDTQDFCEDEMKEIENLNE